MIPLTNYDFQWARSELVIIYPDTYIYIYIIYIYPIIVNRIVVFFFPLGADPVAGLDPRRPQSSPLEECGPPIPGSSSAPIFWDAPWGYPSHGRLMVVGLALAFHGFPWLSMAFPHELFLFFGYWRSSWHLPSGKHTENYGKIHHAMKMGRNPLFRLGHVQSLFVCFTRPGSHSHSRVTGCFKDL